MQAHQAGRVRRLRVCVEWYQKCKTTKKPCCCWAKKTRKDLLKTSRTSGQWLRDFHETLVADLRDNNTNDDVGDPVLPRFCVLTDPSTEQDCVQNACCLSCTKIDRTALMVWQRLCKADWIFATVVSPQQVWQAD